MSDIIIKNADYPDKTDLILRLIFEIEMIYTTEKSINLDKKELVITQIKQLINTCQAYFI